MLLIVTRSMAARGKQSSQRQAAAARAATAGDRGRGERGEAAAYPNEDDSGSGDFMADMIGSHGLIGECVLGLVADAAGAVPCLGRRVHDLKQTVVLGT